MRVVTIRLLPDGSGRVRIHWYMRTPDGPIKPPENGMPDIYAKKLGWPTSGRIMCAPGVKDIRPQIKGASIHPVVHSDDPRAVTCPECMETEEYKKVMEEYALLVDTANPVQVN